MATSKRDKAVNAVKQRGQVREKGKWRRIMELTVCVCERAKKENSVMRTDDGISRFDHTIFDSINEALDSGGGMDLRNLW